VGEQLHLILNSSNHPRRAVSDCGDGDPGPEVDQAIAVNIDHDAPTRFDRENWHRRTDAPRHGPGLSRH
jgi:hypothetical protein